MRALTTAIRNGVIAAVVAGITAGFVSRNRRVALQSALASGLTAGVGSVLATRAMRRREDAASPGRSDGGSRPTTTDASRP